MAGKKITLSYSPATATDEALIESYLPAPHEDGTPIDPSELPSSLPAYLINLKPELRIDGAVVAEGGPVMMGHTEDFYMNFYFPGKGTTPVHNTVEAGDYSGIALDMGRISQEHLNTVRNKLEITKSKIEAGGFSSFNKDDLLGNILSATALAYYMEYDLLDSLRALLMRVNLQRLPSESMFYNDLRIRKSFFSNRPISAEPGRFVMDVDLNTINARSEDGNHKQMISFMKESGVTSSLLENVIPENLLSSEGAPVKGISAVKVLIIANEQNIPIYNINQNNISNLLPLLTIENNDMTEIYEAVNSGMEVIVPKTNIDFNGWNGCGYIFFDSETGAGVYKVSDGLNGGLSCNEIKMLMAFWTGIFVTIGLAMGGIAGAIFLGIIGSIISTYVHFPNANRYDYFNNIIGAFLAALIVGAFASGSAASLIGAPAAFILDFQFSTLLDLFFIGVDFPFDGGNMCTS